MSTLLMGWKDVSTPSCRMHFTYLSAIAKELSNCQQTISCSIYNAIREKIILFNILYFCSYIKTMTKCIF